MDFESKLHSLRSLIRNSRTNQESITMRSAGFELVLHGDRECEVQAAQTSLGWLKIKQRSIRALAGSSKVVEGHDHESKTKGPWYGITCVLAHGKSSNKFSDLEKDSLRQGAWLRHLSSLKSHRLLCRQGRVYFFLSANRFSSDFVILRRPLLPDRRSFP